MKNNYGSVRYVSSLMAGTMVSALALPGPAALAQDVTSAAASAEQGRVEEIFVTAQRRSEKLEKVPASVSVVTEQALSAAGVVRFQDLGNSVVGVQIARTGAFTQPAVRGITTLTSGSGLENNVAVYVDGFYQGDSQAINSDLANIQSVEVLKGPQGTLYGRNATGGAILVNTLAPAEDMHGRINVGYGNFDDRTVSGYISGGIAPMLKASVAGYWRKNDGYLRDVDGFNSAPFENRAIRSKLQFDPVDWAKFTLAYNYLYLNDGRGLTYTEFAQLPVGFVGTTQRDKTSVSAPSLNRAQSNDYTLTSVFDTPIGTLTARTGYVRKAFNLDYDFDGQKRQLFRITGNNRERTWQQGLDYNIDAIDRFALVVGGMYYNDKFQVRDSSTYTNNVVVNRWMSQLRTEAYSFYVDGTYDVTDRLFLTGGARYSHENKQIRFQTIIGTLANTLADPRSQNFSKITPRVSLRYELNDATNIYAAYNKGFKSGTFNTSPSAPALVKPVDQELVSGYEVGVKTTGYGWRWSIAAYYYDYTGLQISTTQLINGVLAQALGNAKAAEIYGAESEINARLSDRFNMSAGVAFNHARYTDLTNAVGTGINPTTGLNATSTQDWSGKTMVRAPGLTANLSGTYTVPMFGGSTALTGSVSHASRYIPSNPSTFVTTTLRANTNSAQRWFISGYTLINLQAAWTAPGDQLTLTVYCNNATGDRYPIVLAGATYGSYRQWNEPRTYGVRASFKF